MKKTLVLISLFIAGVVNASGSVDFLEVENGIVTFSTTDAKVAISPACVDPGNAKLWTLSLNSESGRANYSMLVTALSNNLAVNVESAEDCAYTPGVERARRLWFASN